MNRWEQVEKLCQAALELEESRRAAFLEQACAGDAELRREVESLLQFDDVVETVSLKSRPWSWQRR